MCASLTMKFLCISGSNSRLFALQEAAADGFDVQPSITDAVTHLGAILDTDELQNRVPAPARVPVGLGVYKPQPLRPRVRRFSPALCSGPSRAVP